MVLIIMAIGLVYKRVVLGAKGWEQIPFIGVIREFGNLEAVSFTDKGFLLASSLSRTGVT